MSGRLYCSIVRRQLLNRPPRRPFSRNVATEEQVKTAELQKSPHTPNQVATEIPEVPRAQEVLPIDVPGPLWFHRLGIKDFFSGFARLQRRRPLAMTLGTSLTTYFLGDLIAQEIGGEPYDGTRTLRMLAIGSIASIPGYKWFLYLGSHFNYSRSKFLTISIKVAIQQFLFAPIFNTYFFGMQAVLTGLPPSAVVHRVAQAVPESVISSAKFWPAVTALNFTLIPPPFRFMFSGVFAVIWQTYLSLLNRQEEKAGPSGSLADEARHKLFEESTATAAAAAAADS